MQLAGVKHKPSFTKLLQYLTKVCFLHCI